MLIGVRSSVTLDSRPDESALLELRAQHGGTVTVLDLTDGRVRVESFAPVRCDHLDIVGDLRRLSQLQRANLDALRLP